jgi:hypothetical protein
VNGSIRFGAGRGKIELSSVTDVKELLPSQAATRDECDPNKPNKKPNKHKNKKYDS